MKKANTAAGRRLLAGLLGLLAAGALGIGVHDSVAQTHKAAAPASAAEDTRVPADWKTYDEGGLRFRYPPNLTLGRKGPAVTLELHIRYPNSGDCDMRGGTQEFETLQLFGMAFRFVGKKDIPEDAASMTVGRRKARVDVDGAEGCGDINYFFPLGDGRVLRVDRASVQALAGVSTKWNRAAIERTPGGISNQDWERYFQIGRAHV